MPRLLRHIFICLGVIVMIALQTHGVLSDQHRIEHAVQFAEAAYDVEADQGFEEHAHDRSPAEASDTSATDLDGDGDVPVKHHHHSGGDVHVALAASGYAAIDPLTTSLDLGPVPGLLPPGLTRDEPTDPPKQMRA